MPPALKKRPMAKATSSSSSSKPPIAVVKGGKPSAKKKQNAASSSSSRPASKKKSEAADVGPPSKLTKARREKALDYVKNRMECLTDSNGNIEVSEHMDLLLRLVKDPTLDAATEVLELFEPSKKKENLTAKELDKILEDTRGAKQFCF